MIREMFGGLVQMVARYNRLDGSKPTSNTVYEKLEEVFRMFIGPIAVVIFPELAKKGLTKDNVMGFIDDLVKKKILDRAEGESFKKTAREAMDGKEEKK